MKKVLFLAVSLSLLLVGGTALAAEGGYSFDFSPSFATDPISAVDSGWGFDVGANADFGKLGIKVNLPQNVKLQARASVGYYKWTDSFMKYQRYPFDLGGRFVYSINPQFKAHGDLAIEISRDKLTAFGASDTDTNIGIVPGLGVTYYINDQFYVGADVRYHAINDSYYTLGAVVGFNIP